MFFSRAIGAELAFNVHTVFIRSIMGLGTDEQIAKWVPLAEKCYIAGTYAQTELGHGKSIGLSDSTTEC